MTFTIIISGFFLFAIAAIFKITRHVKQKRRIAAALVAVVMLLATGCSSDTDNSNKNTTGETVAENPTEEAEFVTAEESHRQISYTASIESETYNNGYYMPKITLSGEAADELNSSIRKYYEENIIAPYEKICEGELDEIIQANYQCYSENDILTVEIGILRVPYAADTPDITHKAFFYNSNENKIMTADEAANAEGLDRETLFSEFLSSGALSDENFLFYYDPLYFDSHEKFCDIYKIAENAIRVCTEDCYDLLCRDGSWSADSTIE